MTTHLKPRSTTVALYQGDDMDQLKHLQRAVENAARRVAGLELQVKQGADTARAGDDTTDELAAAKAEVDAARDAFDAFVDDAAGRALSVQLSAIGSDYFAELLVAHPPRKVPEEIEQERALDEAEISSTAGPKMVDHPEDAAWGVNTETFPKALLCFVEDPAYVPEDETPQCTIVSPDLPTPAKRARFVGRELAIADVEKLWITAWGLNQNQSADPNLLRYSAASPGTTET